MTQSGWGHELVVWGGCRKSAAVRESSGIVRENTHRSNTTWTTFRREIASKYILGYFVNYSEEIIS